MVGVTIGVGQYEKLANCAAKALPQMTGLRTVVLGQREYDASGFSSPHFLKLKIFEFVQEESILYFDADMVCLSQWDPTVHQDEHRMIGVVERSHPLITEACQEWGIAHDEYINTGLLFLNRSTHETWLRETKAFVKSHPRLPLFDQTPLNIIKSRLGLETKLIDRRYNWIGYGEGQLCYKIQVIMAHTIRPPSKIGNLEYFEGRYQPPFQTAMEYDEAEIDRLADKQLFCTSWFSRISMTLRGDGVLIGDNSKMNYARYWFVYKSHHREVTLALASDQEILQEYKRESKVRWVPIHHTRAGILQKDLSVSDS